MAATHALPPAPPVQRPRVLMIGTAFATAATLMLFAGLIGIFVALALFGTGPRGSGTRINLGPFQPIELAKLLFIAFLAVYLGSRASKLRFQRQRGILTQEQHDKETELLRSSLQAAGKPYWREFLALWKT